MHDNDSFRLIDKNDALFALMLIGIGVASAFIGDDKERAAKMETAPKQAAVVPCATIEQYGPGERWRTPSSQKSPASACAGAVLDPSHILTSPIVSAQ